MSAAPFVPAPDEVTEPWWDATRSHQLLVQGCSGCTAVQHPPRALCTSCGSDRSLTWREAAGTGVVDSFTVVHRAPRPDVAVPYVVARVRLDEGVILLTRLEGDTPEAPGSWSIDDRVRVDWSDLEDGRALPVFRRAD